MDESRGRMIRFGAFLLLVAALGWYIARHLPAALRGGEGVPSSAAGGAPAVPVHDFFAEFRLERERARGQEQEAVQAVLADARAPGEARQQAYSRQLALAKAAAQEAQAEQLIRARGFEDAVVHLGEGTAQVVVRAASLTPQQAAAIADVVSRATGVKATAITILARE